MKNIESFIAKLLQSPEILSNVASNKGFCTGVDCEGCAFNPEVNTSGCISEFDFGNSRMSEITAEIHENINISAMKNTYPEYFI